jgi:hypothetical protein
MTGPKLVTGIIVMGVAVPLLLFFLLGLQSVSQLLTISAVTFFSWGVADLVTEILVRPRLRDRHPRGALQDWEKGRETGEADPEKGRAPRNA